jgi:hypothetical protein
LTIFFYFSDPSNRLLHRTQWMVSIGPFCHWSVLMVGMVVIHSLMLDLLTLMILIMCSVFQIIMLFLHLHEQRSYLKTQPYKDTSLNGIKAIYNLCRAYIMFFHLIKNFAKRFQGQCLGACIMHLIIKVVRLFSFLKSIDIEHGRWSRGDSRIL